MARIKLIVNGQKRELEIDTTMPLLWVIRDYLGLTGTKYACGIAQCGACIVHVEGEPIRSCVFPVSAAQGKEIITIEGLSKNNDHPIQLAWIEEQVPQCGYCQSGQIMAAAWLLKRNSSPTEKEIDNAMSPVLCRCGTYPRIKKAIQKVSGK
ncbi:MAG: (2Fe-2S)-binding protein [Bacteroidetes bacterium]|nr:MAG: (2Fe-2S)-binding protein [Bacteroidota bacterium]